jgi:hypothetical protein
MRSLALLRRTLSTMEDIHRSAVTGAFIVLIAIKARGRAVFRGVANHEGVAIQRHVSAVPTDVEAFFTTAA